MANLLKVPCILAVTAAVHVIHTQPSTPPKVIAEPIPVASGSVYLNRYAGSAIYFTKRIAWVTAIAEILIIVLPPVLPYLGLSTPPILQVNPQITPSSIVGLSLLLIGGSLRFVCYRTLQRFHTFRLSIVEDHKLVTTGPYSIVRHPSYTAAILASIGMVFWYFTPGSILVEAVGGTFLWKALFAIGMVYITKVSGAVISRIPDEDEMLKSAFGKEWDQWAKAVPYALVPGLY